MARYPLSRRRFLRSSLAASAGLGLVAQAKSPLTATPPHIEGPFYPLKDQSDKDADLTVFGDSTETALGEIIIVEGKVIDESGSPIADAVVDIWQANAAGKYAHELDSSTAEIDPHFQGWAIMKTTGTGEYQFKTVKPGAYPVNNRWTRPPHIHFKVSRRGFKEITTQMYFENEALNDVDHLLNELPQDQQPNLIATRSGDTQAYQFNVVLAKV